MVTIGFTDLDYTLIFGPKACRTPDPLSVSHKDGKPTMFMDARHQAFLQMIRAGCGWLVPVTARGTRLFGKVAHLGFNPGWAILNYGGLIVKPGGEFEPRWLDLIRDQALAAAPKLEELRLAAEFPEGLEVSVCADAGLPFYLQVKNRTNPAGSAVLQDVRAAVLKRLPAEEGWEIHLNANDMAVMPPYLRKENAVRWFLENVAPAERMTVGLGDSRVDLPFMRLCDYVITPSDSQIASTCLFNKDNE